MPIVPPPVPKAAALVDLLQAALVDLIDLSLLSKQGHWCVQGSVAFVPVHRFLDELVDFARDSYDTVAERIVQLGAFPDGRVATVAARSALKQFDAAAVKPEAVAGVVVPNLLALVKRMHQRCLDAADDPVTQNIFIDVAQELEKLSWFWQASQG